MSAAVEAFLDARRAAGLADLSLKSYKDRLGVLLGSVGARPVRYVAGRGLELYTATIVGRKADSHRNFLVVGRIWGKWCVKRKLLKSDPFADVDPVGRRVRGSEKSRLTIDESRQLDVWCRSHPTDPGAILTLGYLLLGSRSSELIGRDVRDLDDDGKILWIRRAKTPSGDRSLEIPPELGALLTAMVAGRPRDAPIFTLECGRRWSRDVARRRVMSACDAAGVPVLSPQALRRTQATIATGAGATGLLVAQQLGHSTGAAPAVTGRSYIGRDAAVAAQGDRARRAIRGQA